MFPLTQTPTSILKMKYKHKSFGYCSQCGFCSCKHLDSDKSLKKFYKNKLKEFSKIIKLND